MISDRLVHASHRRRHPPVQGDARHLQARGHEAPGAEAAGAPGQARPASSSPTACSAWTATWRRSTRSSALAEQYNALVFVDDRHASGFIGKTGRGVHEHFGVMGKIDIITTTLGKGLGGRERRLRVGAEGNRRAVPAEGAAVPVQQRRAAADRGRRHQGARHPEREHRAARQARGELELLAPGAASTPGSSSRRATSPIVPVMLFNAKLAQDVARDLYYEGIYVVGFFFPVVPAGQARIRTQLSADHDIPMLERARSSRSRRSARSTASSASTRRGSSRSTDSREQVIGYR